MGLATVSLLRPPGSYVTAAEVRELISKVCPAEHYRARRVLLLVPDATRTCPLGMFFAGIFDQISGVSAALDVMIALGTHPPMSDEAICRRLEISNEEPTNRYAKAGFFNHAWDNHSELKSIGRITADEIEAQSDGLYTMEVAITGDRILFDY